MFSVFLLYPCSLVSVGGILWLLLRRAMDLTNRRQRQVIIAASTMLLILAATLAPLPIAAAASQTRTIEVKARAFAFEPATLQVNRGDTITIHLESLDAAHGLFIDGYDVNIQAEPGSSAVATFVADREGKFKIRCSISCGTLHPFMIGEMTVEPNVPLVRAMVALLIAAAGTTVVLWK